VNLIRFRLRTIMIVIAFSAVIMAFFPAWSVLRRLTGASVEIEGLSLWVCVGLVSEGSVLGSGPMIMHVYAHRVSLVTILVGGAILGTLITLAVRGASQRKRRNKRCLTKGSIRGHDSLGR
jgi:hypothetical protein